ncbi:FMRFamide receptor-like [Brachionus plicatilis]|uniref:FMRFamide receptor-like n=1 Tax=Brachionus plicatilis TaxID=10195 RepID=A0A3M7P489_BRAPC|nr:FMRFamide receptor-like [Brachionus plicatilis]
MTISDMVSLYWWNINNFLKEFASTDLLSLHMYVCKAGNYLQFTSLQISAWILVVFISFDRFLSIQIKHWKNIYFGTKRALIVALSITALVLLVNVNILFTFGYDTVIGNSSVSFCFEVDGYPSTRWMTVWGQIHLMTYSVIPFLVLLVVNFLLIRKIVSRKSIHTSISNATNIKKSKRNDRINRTVLLLTFLFIVMTLPLACAKLKSYCRCNHNENEKKFPAIY